MPEGKDTTRGGEPRPDRKGWMEDAEGNVWVETSTTPGSGHEYTHEGSDDFGDFELRASYEPDGGWDDPDPQNWVASTWDTGEVERFDTVSGRGDTLEDAMSTAAAYRYNEHRPDTEYDMESENFRGK